MRNFNLFSDTQLVHLFQTGSTDACEVLINRHKDKIFSTILFLVKDKYLAEDLFQETFMRIIDTIKGKRYNDEGKFLPWASRIAHNLCVDHFRKVKRAPSILTTDDRDIFDVINVAEESPEQKMIKSENYDMVHSMLNLLPEEQREVIVLRHFGDMSFKEIAVATDCSINTALGRMRYGLINLRRMMTETEVA